MNVVESAVEIGDREVLRGEAADRQDGAVYATWVVRGGDTVVSLAGWRDLEREDLARVGGKEIWHCGWLADQISTNVVGVWCEREALMREGTETERSKERRGKGEARVIWEGASVNKRRH